MCLLALAGCQSVKPDPVIATAADVASSDGGVAAQASEGSVANVSIGDAITLSLPKDPAYPGRYSVVQTLVARHEGRTQAFQARLDLEPDHVSVVLLAPNGPRAMEIDWDRNGVRESRSRFAPDWLQAQNVLADIFLVHWPYEDIVKALSPHGQVVEAEGVRQIFRDGDLIIEIQLDPVLDGKGREERVLTHLQRGYALQIFSDAQPTG